MENNAVQEKAVAAPAEPKKSFIDVVIGGAKKGVGVWLNALLPGVVFGYALTQILQVLGVMDLLATICGPIMAIFGLPGEAMACFFTGFFSLAAACASAASLAAAGVMTGAQVTILLPMLICVGSGVQFMGRMLAVAEVPGNKYMVNLIISIICAVVAGFIMNIIV